MASDSIALATSSQIGRDISDAETRSYNFVDVKNTSIFLTPLCATSLKEILDQHNTDVSKRIVDQHI